MGFAPPQAGSPPITLPTQTLRTKSQLRQEALYKYRPKKSELLQPLALTTQVPRYFFLVKLIAFHKKALLFRALN